MKTLAMVFALTALQAFGATAPTSGLPDASSSWGEIEGDYGHRVKIDYAMVSLDNAGVTSVRNLCFNGESLETIGYLKKCADEFPRARRGQRLCSSYEYFKGVANITGVRTVCGNWINLGRGERECGHYEDERYQLPLSYKIPVYNKRHLGNAEYEYEFMFEKTYAVPNC